MNNMRLLIATGIFPPDIGGPAEYAKNLFEEFSAQGYKVKVLTYKIEKKLPIIIRHIFYFLKIIFYIYKVDLIIALDTFSVGLPAVLAAKIFNKKIIVRVGGDFLWENYVETTGNLITLSDFYGNIPDLSLKQKIIFYFSGFVFRNCARLVFSTEWQKIIMEKNYNLDNKKSLIIENFYGDKLANFEPKEKNFIFAGRMIKLKNLEMLKSAFSEAFKENKNIKLEIISGISQEELMERIRRCYAVILPSLSEVSPNFILDAIRADKPFILTKETGFQDKLGRAGIFIDPLNKEDIKNKILFLSDDNVYNEYKRKIANFKFNHSWKKIADEFLAIYKNI